MQPKTTLTSLILLTALAGSALAAPPNDNLSAATPLAFPLSGSVAGTTVAATRDGPTTACASIGSGLDVWYVITTATATGVTVDTCEASTGFDTLLQVFDVGAGGALGAQVACNDDDATCGGNRSKLSFTSTAGASYYIRVTGWNSASGVFALKAYATAAPPPPPPAEIPTPSLGPDVTIGNLSDVNGYGTTTFNGVAYAGFAVGTDSWNIGDRQAVWISSTNQHPVIGQQMYKLKNGRFEQIGVSWVKHGFFATNSQSFQSGMAYPSDTNRVCVPSSQGGAALGVNCSDLYGSGLNGGRSYLGPRYDINPITGAFTYPWTPLVNNFTPSDSTDKASRRIFVKASDLGDASARYFVDAVYITPDDAAWGNGRNNYTAREIAVPSAAAGAVGFLSADNRRKTALEVYAATDSSVRLVPVDFHEITMTVNDTLATPPGPRSIDVQGRFQVTSKVINNNNGTWDYEYSVLNVNSHRGVGRFAVGAGGVNDVSNIGQASPTYHSGDRIDNSPWVTSTGPGYQAWDVQMTFPNTVTIPGAPTASATVTGVGPKYVRWGALHNYRFTSTKAPVDGYVRLGLGRAPANSTGFQGNSLVVTGLQVPGACKSDVAGLNQSIGGDGQLSADDIITFLNGYFAGDLWSADVSGLNQSSVPDGQLTADDIIVFLSSFFAGC